MHNCYSSVDVYINLIPACCCLLKDQGTLGVKNGPDPKFIQIGKVAQQLLTCFKIVKFFKCINSYSCYSYLNKAFFSQCLNKPCNVRTSTFNVIGIIEFYHNM